MFISPDDMYCGAKGILHMVTLYVMLTLCHADMTVTLELLICLHFPRAATRMNKEGVSLSCD